MRGKKYKIYKLFVYEFHGIIILMSRVIEKKHKLEIEELKVKASILDELIDLIEDRYFGYLMKLAEKEKNIPLKKAKKFIC